MPPPSDPVAYAPMAASEMAAPLAAARGPEDCPEAAPAVLGAGLGDIQGAGPGRKGSGDVVALGAAVGAAADALGAAVGAAADALGAAVGAALGAAVGALGAAVGALGAAVGALGAAVGALGTAVGAAAGWTGVVDPAEAGELKVVAALAGTALKPTCAVRMAAIRNESARTRSPPTVIASLSETTRERAPTLASPTELATGNMPDRGKGTLRATLQVGPKAFMGAKTDEERLNGT